MDFSIDEKVQIIALQRILNKYRMYDSIYCLIDVNMVDNGNFLFKKDNYYVLGVMTGGVITDTTQYLTLHDFANQLIATLVEINKLRSAVCTYDRECKNLSVKTEEEIDEIFCETFLTESENNVVKKAKVIA